MNPYRRVPKGAVGDGVVIDELSAQRLYYACNAPQKAESKLPMIWALSRQLESLRASWAEHARRDDLNPRGMALIDLAILATEGDLRMLRAG